MITYQLKNNELIIDGTMKDGENLHGQCCAGYDWEVSNVFPHKNPGYVSVWGTCQNPYCPVNSDPPGNMYHGVSSFLQEDIADTLLAEGGEFAAGSQPLPDDILSDYSDQEKAEFCNDWRNELGEATE